MHALLPRGRPPPPPTPSSRPPPQTAPPAPTPPAPRVLTDSWGVGRIRTTGSRPPCAGMSRLQRYSPSRQGGPQDTPPECPLQYQVLYDTQIVCVTYSESSPQHEGPEDFVCARRGRHALRPTEGTPAAGVAQLSGLWRKGKVPSTKLRWDELRTTVRPPCGPNHPGYRTSAPPASTIQEHTPPAEVRTTPAATMQVRVMPTCAAHRDGVIGHHAHSSAGRQVLDDKDNTPRSGVFGPHAHGTTAQHVVDDLSAGGNGQQKV